jgi:exosortase E/protease (VPEID-CTERM system)
VHRHTPFIELTTSSGSAYGFASATIVIVERTGLHRRLSLKMSDPLHLSVGDIASYKSHEGPNFETPPLPTAFLKRIALLSAIAAIELVLYYCFFDGSRIHGDLVAACAAATLVFTWPASLALIRSAAADSNSEPERNRALLVHIVISALLIGWSSIAFRYVSTPATAVASNLGRFVLLVAAVGSILLALAPWQLWLRWYSSSKTGIAVGASFGFAVWIIKFLVRSAWWSADGATLYGSYLLLWLFGQHPTIGMRHHLLGVSGFKVQVTSECAGLEGIVLVALLTGLYLWIWRKEFRFPAVLVLIPIGIAASWLLNMGRIAILVVLWVHHPVFAQKVFHSVAGWMLFNVIGLGVIAASNEFDVFRADRVHDVPSVAHSDTPAGAYLLPLVVTIAAAMLTHPYLGRFDRLYPVSVILVGCVLFGYRREYMKFEWTLSWQAVAIGAIVSAVWIISARLSAPVSNAGFENGLHGLSRGGEAFVILMRTIGAVITVPMAEELAFRGYLIRKLISAEFESVDPGRFTWFSFLLSSILFGAVNDSWVVGTLAGMAFAIALYRRGRISDAIIAHATSNALIAVFVLSTGSWSLWS